MTNITLNPQQPKTAEMAQRMDEVKGRSLWADARTRFLRNKAAMVSLVVLGLVAAFAFFGQHLSAFDNETIDWDVLGNVKEMGRPSLDNGHFFGFDDWHAALRVQMHAMFEVFRNRDIHHRRIW